MNDWESRFRTVDPEIRPLVIVLNQAGIETDWSCSGEPGHMVIRPTIQARTHAFASWEIIAEQRRHIEGVMARFGIEEYWLALVFTYGRLNTHGGEPTWLLQIPGRFDWLALPVAFSQEYIDGEDDLVIGYQPYWRTATASEGE